MFEDVMFLTILWKFLSWKGIKILIFIT
jgi:hypothetical protein